MTLDEQIESDLLDMWLLWERGNWYLNDDHPNYEQEHDRRFRDAIVEYITKLIADEVKKARIDELNNIIKPNVRYYGDAALLVVDINNRLAELQSTLGDKE